MKNPFDTPERVAFRKTLRNFVAKEIKPNADTWDEVGEIPWDLHQRVGALGVWGFGIEEQYGGLGMDDCFMRAAYNEEFAMCGANGVPAALNGRMISIEPIQRLLYVLIQLLPLRYSAFAVGGSRRGAGAKPAGQQHTSHDAQGNSTPEDMRHAWFS